MSQRGFSLLEAVIVAAIVATVAAIFFGAPLASKPAALHSAAAQYDAALAYARAYASANGGASLTFTALNSGSVAIRVAGAPPFVVDAEISDKTLGPPPFTVTLNAAGHASGQGCPAAGWALTLRAGLGETVRPLPCYP